MRLTRFQRRLLERARPAGVTPCSPRETNSAERLVRKGLLIFTPGLGYSDVYCITEAGRSALRSKGESDV